jgi:hypothetical protein
MITAFIPKRPADALPADANLARTTQLVAIFAQLGDYGQRVTLAQMAAMLRVQAGGK